MLADSVMGSLFFPDALFSQQVESGLPGGDVV